MAPTRLAAAGPTPKAAPTTQNNGIKKVTPPSKGAEQHIYVVTRQIVDPYNCHDSHEIRGTFKSLAAANAAARKDLISDWDKDYFETYEIEEVSGMVHIVAACPEGKEMVVMVEKAEVKKGAAKKAADKTNAAENNAVKNAVKNVTIVVPPPPKEITMYQVTRHTIDYHHDYNGGLQDTDIQGSYLSRKKANAVARRNLLDDWDRDFFEEYEEEVVGGLVTITAVCPEGEEMTVSVVEGKLDIGDAKIIGLDEEEEEEGEGDEEDEEDEEDDDDDDDDDESTEELE
ncbi:hypothetical protein V500_02556 [Pseudogymnoascus sp. VKM F-4518 (FW-2643)]|nr:hypothetical protein V500_02556 [Pseudogymnoascus sp. VKM F-4518 (FW-2643)]